MQMRNVQLDKKNATENKYEKTELKKASTNHPRGAIREFMLSLTHSHLTYIAHVTLYVWMQCCTVKKKHI